METPTPDEKVLATPPIAVRTTHIHEKTSEDTLTTPARRSDISTPTSATANPFDTDVEAMMSGVTTSETVRGPNGAPCYHNASAGDQLWRKSTNLARGESQQEYCQVWPGRGHWKRKAKAAKRKNRSCNCLAGLSQRNRLIVKILIGILVVAAAVGVGFGISKPLGAQIWKPSTR